MVAVITPITVQPALKPRYLNRNVGHFQLWYRDNEPKLGEYFLALPNAEADYEDFREFALCQHDAEQVLESEARYQMNRGEPDGAVNYERYMEEQCGYHGDRR